MDTKRFCDASPQTPQALVPENPRNSDAELSDCDSDDERIEAPDSLAMQAEDSGETYVESMDDEEEEETASTSSTSEPLFCKRSKGKTALKTVALDEPEDTSYSVKAWKHEDIEAFQVPLLNLQPPDSVISPLRYFRSLFTPQMVAHIAYQTNLYSTQRLGQQIVTNPQEIENFLAILLFMGVFKFPSIDDYWHNDSRFNVVADLMTRNRFRLLCRFVHFNNNSQWCGSQDRFFKIRPLFEMLREQCLIIPSTSSSYSIHEIMVPYEGTARAGDKPGHHIAQKTDKNGFKLFCRASSSGIIHDLLLYQGATTFSYFDYTPSESLGQEQELLLGDKLVMSLCRTITHPQLSVVYFGDNLTSFRLMQNLDTNLGIKCIGAIQPTQMGEVPLIPDQQLSDEGQGAFDYRSSDGVIAVKWFNGNQHINVLSNAVGISPLSVVQRCCRVHKTKIAMPCPLIINAYHQHMGSIDLSNKLVHMYQTPVKSRRWYIPLFRFILDLCVSNSWLVYKRDCELLNEVPMSLKRFRLAVAHTLKKVSKSATETNIGRRSYTHISRVLQPHPDLRFDNRGHMPIHSLKRGRCIFCPKGVSRWKCEKCDVFLCLNANQKCFVDYHKK